MVADYLRLSLIAFRFPQFSLIVLNCVRLYAILGIVLICLQMSLIGFNCLRLSWISSNCLDLSSIVFSCLQFPSILSHCLQLSSIVSHFLQVSCVSNWLQLSVILSNRLHLFPTVAICLDLCSYSSIVLNRPQLWPIAISCLELSSILFNLSQFPPIVPNRITKMSRNLISPNCRLKRMPYKALTLWPGYFCKFRPALGGILAVIKTHPR